MAFAKCLHVAYRHAHEARGWSVDMAELGFFTENESCTRYAVPQREGFHRQVFAVEQYSFARGVDDVEFQVEAQLLAEHVENLAQDALAFCEGVHSHGASVLV